ncbi:MFS transporter [Streptomyces sp. BI20]|uniref:MFS transporter n=1 Tax=Streptomyces sp. BI20 TaxID=3403460 RepID=UPI003C7585D3
MSTAPLDRARPAGRPTPPDGGAVDSDRLYTKVARRLLPLLGLLYLVSYLDRSNIAFAAPNGMNEELALTSAAFGLASGIFFLGYSLVEVPSNLALRRFGARAWLVRILVSWGIVATATAFVTSAGQLQTARLLLGIAEAGCLPGIVYYLTLWLPRSVRTRLMAVFFVALPLSTALGAPLSGWLMQAADGMFGLSGWRAMFLLEGLPALLLAVVVWKMLPDGPAEARWLTPRERDHLLAAVARDEEPPATSGAGSEAGSEAASAKGGGWFTPRTLLLGLAYFGIIYGLYALSFFLPTIIAGFQGEGGAPFTLLERGLINAVPYALGAVAMLWWGRRAQSSTRVSRYVAVPAVVAGVSVPLALYMGTPMLTMVVISVTAVSVLSAIPVFWSLPTATLTKKGAAGGIALVNTIGSLGGFAAPYFTGWLKDWTGSVRPGLWLTGGLLIMSAVLVTLLARGNRQAPAGAEPAADAHPAAEPAPAAAEAREATV